MSLDRVLLAKILGLLGSDQDGEVLAAARMAARMLKEARLTWPDVLGTTTAPGYREVYQQAPQRPQSPFYEPYRPRPGEKSFWDTVRAEQAQAARRASEAFWKAHPAAEAMFEEILREQRKRDAQAESETKPKRGPGRVPWSDFDED